jgi:DNA-directed RNA polymerase subunit D
LNKSSKVLNSPSVELIERGDESISVKFKNVPREYVNALRRLAISEVPTLAIDDVVMIENSSVVHDEAVAHRLGMIPLHTDLKRFVMPHDCDCKSTLGCSKCRVLLVLDAEAPERTRIVTSGELKSEDEEVKPVSDDIPIITLAPGQKIKFEAYARLGNGKSHAKWQPTSAAIVKDGDNENEAILIIETNQALKPHEVILAAFDMLNAKIKNFGHAVQGLGVHRGSKSNETDNKT